MMKKYKNVNQYITSQPKDKQLLLKKIRKTIRDAAPKAEEIISYGMPAYRYHGTLVYFAGCKNHIGFYPMPAAIRTFKKELMLYEQSKGAVQFPLDKPLPLELVKKIVRYRIKQNPSKTFK